MVANPEMEALNKRVRLRGDLSILRQMTGVFQRPRGWLSFRVELVFTGYQPEMLQAPGHEGFLLEV